MQDAKRHILYLPANINGIGKGQSRLAFKDRIGFACKTAICLVDRETWNDAHRCA